MKRLLCIVGSMNAGGAETFLMKIYREIDRNNYQMDFAVTEDGIYDQEIKEMGGKIHLISPKSKGAIRNFNEIRHLVLRERYQSVLRVSQNSLSALELFAAMLGEAKIRAYRSSNSNTVHGTKKEIIIHRMFRWMPMLFANVRFAPSTEAAEYMFGKNCIKNGRAQIIHNGINLDDYKFSEEKRFAIRKELGIDDKVLVIGHVGRFNQQKNHKFLIRVFEEIVKQNNNAIMILCGKGELENDIRKVVQDKGLLNHVKFLGVRTDIGSVLSAMDVFVFPSLYEGMPNTVIEAQANGLPCIISDTITKEAKILNIVESKSLTDEPKEWARDAILLAEKDIDRTNQKRAMKDAGYDIHEIAEEIEKILF